MTFDFAHTLTPDDARARMEALSQYFSTKHGLKVSWSGDRGRVLGKVLGMVSIDGEFVLGEGKVHVQAKDPGMLWRKKAAEYLQRKFGEYLDPKRRVEDLPRG